MAQPSSILTTNYDNTLLPSNGGSSRTSNSCSSRTSSSCLENAKQHCHKPFQYLESCQQRLGDDNPEALKVMHSLARALDEQGRYEHTQELYETCLQQQQLVLGSDDHPDCLKTTNSLAGILYKEGHYDESQRMNECCLEKKWGYWDRAILALWFPC
jgi:tetratricopeptide (TPR) repeat protein